MFVLVTGAAGQLGLSLNHLVDQNSPNHQFIFATREELDLSDFKYVRNFIEKKQFDVIINCAAYTAVDKAESQKVEADLVNHLSVKNIAEIANDNCIKLINCYVDLRPEHDRVPHQSNGLLPFVEKSTSNSRQM